MSFWMGHHADLETTPTATLMDVIGGDCTLPATVLPAITHADHAGRVNLVAADGSLAGAEGALRARPGAALWLKRQLRTLPGGRWDWIVMDCPPGLGILTIAALTAADVALSPAVPNVLDSAGIGQVSKPCEYVTQPTR